MNKEVFDKEMQMCKDLSLKNGGKCNWGACESCGVIPLLYKLHKGEFLETPEDILNVKKDII